jgi:hypothetical protein
MLGTLVTDTSLTYIALLQEKAKPLPLVHIPGLGSGSLAHLKQFLPDVFE